MIRTGLERSHCKRRKNLLPSSPRVSRVIMLIGSRRLMMAIYSHATTESTQMLSRLSWISTLSGRSRDPCPMWSIRTSSILNGWIAPIATRLFSCRRRAPTTSAWHRSCWESSAVSVTVKSLSRFPSVDVVIRSQKTSKLPLPSRPRQVPSPSHAR